jgi:hypothetical protein
MTSRAAEPAKLRAGAHRPTGPIDVSGTLAVAEEQALVARAKSGDRRAFE